jgi:hypothetical protein
MRARRQCVQPAGQFGANRFAIEAEVKTSARLEWRSSDLLAEREGVPGPRKIIKGKRRPRAVNR